MPILNDIAALDHSFSGTLGLWARSLENGETLSLKDTEPFHPASTLKVPILYEVWRQAMEGRIRLEQPLTVQPGDLVGGAGVLKDLEPGFPLSVQNLAALMIIVSDNTATNMLIDLVGRESVNQAMASLGLPEIRLENKLMMPRLVGPHNSATPAALGQLMERIAQRSVLSPDACDQIVRLLEKQHYKDRITRFLPEADPYPEEPLADPVTVASKPGEIRGVRNDLAFVRSAGRGYILCMMSKNCADLRYYPDNEGNLLLANVARLLHRHFTAEHG